MSPSEQTRTITAAGWTELERRVTELEAQGWKRPSGCSSVSEHGRVTFSATMRKPTTPVTKGPT